jgi:hypothetical protein
VTEVQFFGLGEQSLLHDRHELHEGLVRAIRAALYGAARLRSDVP